jgi:hypothetical protein
MARAVYSEQTAAFVMNRPAPYAVRLQFEPPTGHIMYTDKVTIMDYMLHQAGEKIKDVLGRKDS